MHVSEKSALHRVIVSIRERFSDRITAVYAFGSRVRGDNHGWSDLDLLIVVQDRNPDLEEEIVSMLVDEELQSGLSLSPVIKDLKAFEQERKFRTPFYRNIVNEGVPL